MKCDVSIKSLKLKISLFDKVAEFLFSFHFYNKRRLITHIIIFILFNESINT